MINLDNAAKKKTELRTALAEAFKSGDENKISEAMVALGEFVQNDLLEKARNEARGEDNDRRALSLRSGYKPLTETEKKYYNAVINNHGFAGIEELVPETVINRVFEELEEEHPLLNHIEFVTVGANTKWILKSGKKKAALWSELISDIQEVLDEGFETLDLGLHKLSGFMPVHNAMLDLGPEWLDRYVRTILAEAVSIGLEEGIVAGNGLKMPAGMIMDMSNLNSTTGYAKKTAAAITDLKPKTIAEAIMAPLTKGGTKVITPEGANGVIYVVNPLDYWNLIYPAVTPYVTAQGVYKYNVMPMPGTFVQSAAMPRGFMVAGKGKDYFMGVGATRKFEVLKELRAIQDQTIYLTKMYGNGRPLDNESFVYLDITGLTPAA